MRDFIEYDNNLNKVMISSGERIFEKQLNGVEGKDVLIDDIPFKAILLNHLNDTSISKEDRILNTQKDVVIKRGSYIKIPTEDQVYMVLSDVDDHYAYNSSTIRRCKSKINITETISFHAVVEGESYGVKIFQGNNEFTSGVDTKIKITLSDNEVTRKYIKPNLRIMLNNSKYGIYKIGDILVYEEGLIVCTCKKDSYIEGMDDLEKGICYQAVNDDALEEPKLNIEIIGEDSLRNGVTANYSISDNVNGYFEIDEYYLNEGIVEIVDKSAILITIKVLKANAFFELKYIYNGNEITKNVLTTR